jgi:5'-nucleotidase (lipoprotein e(P4) family)
VRRLATLFVALAFTACASAPPPAAPPAAPMNPAPTPATVPATAVPAGVIPASLHWFRDSAERRALSLQTYAAASAHLESAVANLPRGSWAVILDADETVIDNSQYQRELWLSGKTAFDEALWSDWVSRAAAPPLAGASEFLDLVHRLGGKIAIVTNRSLPSCDATRTNFTKQDLPYDVMLCKDKDGDKNPRFNAVAQGGTPLGPVKVILWVGDNIRDFPGLDQAARLDPSRLGEFGTRFFLLPNPMYGSWESNPTE